MSPRAGTSTEDAPSPQLLPRRGERPGWGVHQSCGVEGKGWRRPLAMG